MKQRNLKSFCLKAYPLSLTAVIGLLLINLSFGTIKPSDAPHGAENVYSRRTRVDCNLKSDARDESNEIRRIHSWIIVTRNDSHGSSEEYEWNVPIHRLKIVLHFLAQGLIHSNLVQSSEILIVDWNSEFPLAINDLYPQNISGVREITKLIQIKPGIAQRYSNQPLSEVHAINLAYRLSEGQILWRLDQDTVPLQPFFDWISEFYSNDKASCIFWSTRRDCNLIDLLPGSNSIPYTQKDVQKIADSAEMDASNSCPIWGKKETFYDFLWGAVGILGLPRQIVFMARGYCEKMEKWGHMELEMLDRIVKPLKEDPDPCLLHLNRIWNSSSSMSTWKIPFFHLPHETHTRESNDKKLVSSCSSQFENEDWGLGREKDMFVSQGSAQKREIWYNPSDHLLPYTSHQELCYLLPYDNNFGDQIGPEIIRRLVSSKMQREVQLRTHDMFHSHPDGCLVALGSIFHFVKPGDSVWGTGVNPHHKRATQKNLNIDIYALRGSLSRNYLRENLQINETKYSDRIGFGDPAMLIPFLFPEYQKASSPKHSVCIIPHHNDRNVMHLLHPYEDFVVWPTEDYDVVVNYILNCSLVVSSSLHGIIVAEAFGVPARWLKLPGSETSKTEGSFKYNDYYNSTNRSLDDFATSIEEAIRVGGKEPISDFNYKALADSFPIHLF